MRDLVRSVFGFPWTLGRAAFEAGNRLQTGMLDWMLGPGPGREIDPAAGEYPGSALSTRNMDLDAAPSVRLQLGVTTQGPFWPPAAQLDDNGDFILIGNILTETRPGTVVPVPGAAIISKDTVPPLDRRGREDFSNFFAAPYKVIRHLDLSPGSPDLSLMLHSVSWGPAEGDWGGGGPRMPRVGESRYNLNSFHTNGYVCREIFPAASQKRTYTRPSFPLHRVPIPGFQGDQVAYDVDTGEPFTPTFRSGPDCPPGGCAGEDVLNYRREEPVTLGEWIRAQGSLTITLTNYKGVRGQGGGYTAAIFDLQVRHLLPNSIYLMATIRTNQFEPRPIRKLPDSSVLPNIVITDATGAGRLTRVIPHPFPDPATDGGGLRIVGVGVGYKSDYTVFGACPVRFGAGVDIHAQLTSFAAGVNNLAPFVTIPP